MNMLKAHFHDMKTSSWPILGNGEGKKVLALKAVRY